MVVAFTRKAARRLEGVSGSGGLFMVGEGPWVVVWCRWGDFAISAYDGWGSLGREEGPDRGLGGLW